jgi:hypothetical protein
MLISKQHVTILSEIVMVESMLAKDVSGVSITANPEAQKKNRTVTVSFRLPESMVEELLKEVERSGSNPSAIVRKVLEKHLNWDRYRLQMNMISFPDCFVDESLKRLSRKDIGDVASRFASVFCGLVLLKTGRTDFEPTMKMIEEWFKDGSINYRHGYDNGCHVFVVQHSLDVNWSLYLANFFTAVCRDLNVYSKVEMSQDGKTLLFFARDDRNKASYVPDPAAYPDLYAELEGVRKNARYGQKGFKEQGSHESPCSLA